MSIESIDYLDVPLVEEIPIVTAPVAETPEAERDLPEIDPEFNKAVRDAQDGDKDAFSEFWQRVAPGVRYHIQSIEPGEMSADYLQIAALNTFRGLDSFKIHPNEALVGPMTKGWVKTIARNATLTEKRRESRRITTESIDEVVIDSGTGSAPVTVADFLADETFDTPEAAFDEKESNQSLMGALALLPEEFRNAFVAVGLEGMPQQAAADALGVPLGTIQSRFFRAKQKLQKLILAGAAGEDLRDQARQYPKAAAALAKQEQVAENAAA